MIWKKSRPKLHAWLDEEVTCFGLAMGDEEMGFGFSVSFVV
jgi:hypothetical protein